MSRFLTSQQQYHRLPELESDIDYIHDIEMDIDLEKTASTSKNEQYHLVDENSSSNIDNDITIGKVKETKVQRQLKPRHVSMIALGGTIGTGLFIGISTSLAEAGPVSALIAYLFMGSLVYSVTQSLGEMATHIPVTGSFCQFVTRYVSRALGAANGWLYWFSWAITFAIELSVVGQVIQYWTFAVPLAAWIGIFFVILTAANLVPVKFYGEVEFWIASIKVIAIVGWLIYALCMVCGAGKTGPVGFRYWRNPGPWGPGILVDNKNTGRFLGWLSTLISAAFTYQGTELVGVTAGECSNPRRTVPKAINKVFIRIMIFYIASIFFIGLLVPYNDPALTSSSAYISSSPFVIAINNSGTKVLPDIFNAVILSTIISAGNSNVYIGSRVLYSLGQTNVAPKCFTWTNKHGTPYVGVFVTAAFGLLGFMVTSNSGTTVFNWFVNITAVAGLITWSFISISHIRFMQVLKHRGMLRDELPFKAKFMPFAAYYAAVALVIITFIQGYSSFFQFTATKFFTAYISLILFFVLWIGFQIYFKEPWIIPIEDVDIDTGKREIDDMVWEEDAPKTLWDKFWNMVA